MALTLRDVVENRSSQRASDTRRMAAERLDADRSRRERFSLEDADRSADLQARAQASARAGRDAAPSRPDPLTRPADGSRSPPPAASDLTRADDGQAATARSEPFETGVSIPAAARPAKAGAADVAPAAEPADAGASQGAPSETDATASDAAPAEDAAADGASPPSGAAQEKPSTRPSAAEGKGRPEAPAKPTTGKPAAAGRTGGPAPGAAGAPEAAQPTSEGETAEAAAASADRVGADNERIDGTPPATASLPVPPTMAVFAAPVANALPVRSQTPAAGGPDQEAASGIEESGGTANGPSSVAAGPGSGRSGAAAKPGFEAALAEIASGDAAAGTSAAASSPGAETPATGATAAPASTSTETKAAAAPQAQAPAAPPSPPVPLGAVPMTIGLRALGASNRFEIRLDPKELGRIDVSIDIDKDTGTVGARLVVDRPETLALLHRDASSLQQALAQTGLDASAGISLSLRGDNADGRGDGNASGSDAQARDAGQTARADARNGSDQTLIDLAPLRMVRGLGRIDIRI